MNIVSDELNCDDVDRVEKENEILVDIDHIDRLEENHFHHHHRSMIDTLFFTIDLI